MKRVLKQFNLKDDICRTFQANNMELIKNLSDSKELIIHPIIGMVIGYFILHPISMFIFWYEINDASFSLSRFVDVFSKSFIQSFSFNMMPMSLSFTVLGLSGGFASGFFSKTLKQKKNR